MGEQQKVERITVFITPVGFAELNRKANQGDVGSKVALEVFKFKVEPGLDDEWGEELMK